MREPGSLNIAIHLRPESFSDRWIDYCRAHRIAHTLVDCYRNDILDQVKGCDGLMWHWDQKDYMAVLFARQLTYSLETIGFRVFPDSRTCWHFDDKVGQKYLLEAVGAPLVPSYVFYDKERAREWIASASFPKVFKLRVGSSSSNVRLVRTREEAHKLCDRAFGAGFRPVAGYLSDSRHKWRKVTDASALLGKIGRIPASVARIRAANALMGRERGYVYFQDFVPGNSFDTRVFVVGEKAVALRRSVRKNDFRASGSGMPDYRREAIDERCVASAWTVSERLGTQALACDYIFQDNEVRLVEISYGSPARLYDGCPGYWDRNMGWHDAAIAAEDLIMEMFLNRLAGGQAGTAQ